ncbi:MFS transporter [Paenarthrobacter sp. Z7-10]|uniref:MFS transporter n=1 Tax=Paenarthrobacter sp. Z7-10 TaxID=2787635 RepID=UPI0022A95C03|nr:MFS transporter [Paenarthrobacter sp. Z7-10]MCZ2402476.1 MFS transporter [Paenarthrobacter sp. Z7-10]
MSLDAPGLAAHQRRVLMVTILASFVAILDGSVVNLALPAIQRDFGGGILSQQWVVDAYLLTLGALILVAGSLSDLFGRVRILQWGLIGFAAMSVLCGFAVNNVMLILGRGLQGAAGALLVPSSLALIISEFSGHAQAKAIGRWTAWTGASTIVAPLVGGAAVDLLSWRFVFFVNLIPVLISMPLLAALRHTDAPRDPGVRVDILGTVLAVVGLGGSVFALIEQGSFGWRSPVVLIPLLLGPAALVAFVVHERRSASPMMPLELFGVRNFSAGNVATLMIYGALSLGFFVLTIYLQQVAGLPATLAGIALLPATMALLALSSRFGALAGRRGPRLFMTVGPAVAGVGFLLLLSVGHPINYWLTVLPGILVFGLGLSITVAPLTSAILGSVAPARAGMGSAINNAVARIAGLVSIAFAGVVVGGTLDTAGLHRAAIVTAVLLFAGAAISAIGISNTTRPAQ